MHAASRFASAALLVSLAAGCSAPAQGAFSDGGNDEAALPGEPLTASFDAPDDLAEFDVVLGDWEVRDGNARQSGAFDNPEFPRIIRRNLVFTNVDVSTRCKPESGLLDQVCGIMFHVVDSENYLLVRANALESNVRLYHIVDGVRTETASVDLDVTAGEFHDLGVSTGAGDVTVSWDDDVVLAGTDATFAGGHVGLWTKADSVTSYDALTAMERPAQ